MALTTSLAGRVRNTSLPKSHALLPLQEAIVNAIQAIDARPEGAATPGHIEVQVHRDLQDELDLGQTGPGRTPLKPITGFSVQDDGVGFTRENMLSFETLDSDFKSNLGCRGVGRLLWLKAFDRVSIHSTFKDESGSLKGRRFRFSIEREVEHDSEIDALTQPGTVVSLDGFKKSFQQQAPKGVDAIAREVFEHCIWYFLRAGGAPTMVIKDDDESIALVDLMDDFVDSDFSRSRIEVGERAFEMLNLRLKPSTRNALPRLYWCAGSRVVLDESLNGKLPGLHGKLKNSRSGDFVYACYLTSDYLDGRVRSDRTAFDIADRVAGQAFAGDPTLEEIRAAVLLEVGDILQESLRLAKEQGKERVHAYVSQRAPRYRPILRQIEERGVTVDPAIKDHELEMQLHGHLQRIESEALARGQEIFAEADAGASEDYPERLADYLSTVSEINQSDLAAYVSRRRTVLDLLARLIRADQEGRYSREDAIHSLIVPMRKDSSEFAMDGSNLWIVDERLAFHDYLASDKTLRSMPITMSDSTTEPDIVATRLVDAPVLAAEGQRLPLTSIVVVEIKRPMRKDATEDKNPITQCLDYVKRIREGGVKTAAGRPIPPTHEPPAFCYIIADLTEKMIERCDVSNLRPTHDNLGYFGFNDRHRAYIEVISFDGLVNSATERNRAFFDKLGLPILAALVNE
ncbi:ATP-binding protein [Quadrisphaera oryzae]|uniref:ATP-binding protein n=1 Tax=Quadrisphaera TaxID=317661 RepID=UPI0016486AF2|nr:ATP-binding protein [Quadrisphaera sp. RL12-1S]MBC3763437.1 sensor histidine kinase [Quadrisphaera sp. RL12-1S]